MPGLDPESLVTPKPDQGCDRRDNAPGREIPTRPSASQRDQGYQHTDAKADHEKLSTIGVMRQQASSLGDMQVGVRNQEFTGYQHEQPDQPTTQHQAEPRSPLECSARDQQQQESSRTGHQRLNEQDGK